MTFYNNCIDVIQKKYSDRRIKWEIKLLYIILFARWQLTSLYQILFIIWKQKVSNTVLTYLDNSYSSIEVLTNCQKYIATHYLLY